MFGINRCSLHVQHDHQYNQHNPPTELVGQSAQHPDIVSNFEQLVILNQSNHGQVKAVPEKG